MLDADHEETSPQAATLLIHRLSCSLVGQVQTIQFMPGSRVAASYGQTETQEDFRCNYGFNEAFTEKFRGSALQFVGFDRAGELRVVELPTHPFYVATLFLPQMRSRSDQPHPLISTFVQAASTSKNAL